MAERPERVGGGMRWKLVFLLFVLSAVTYLDRVNLSIVGTSLMRSYGLRDLELGWMFSAFLLAYGLFQTPAGWFADRVGPRRALAWATVWWGLFTVLTTVVPAGRYAIVVLIGVRFLLGCGEAVLYPAASLLTENWVPSHEKGKANGLIFAGVGAGAGISPPLISFVMSRAGWRASFWLSAGIGLCVGLVWYLVARDRPEEHPRASVEERAYRVGARVASSGSAWAVIRSWNLLAITAAYFTFGYVAWLFFSWFYIYLARERHLDLKQSAIYGMLPFLAMAVGSFAGGALVAGTIDPDRESGTLTCERMSIINGAQTIRSLLAAVNRPGQSIHKPVSTVRVLMRLMSFDYPTEVPFVNEVTKYNNTQNAVKVANFRSNDEAQKDMARRFNNLNLNGRKYEYKNKRSDKRRNSIAITLEELTKAVYAFRFGPDDMSGGTNKLFDASLQGFIQRFSRIRTVQ